MMLSVVVLISVKTAAFLRNERCVLFVHQRFLEFFFFAIWLKPRVIDVSAVPCLSPDVEEADAVSFCWPIHEIGLYNVSPE